MSTNNKTSILISSQLPAFVREDNPNFVLFMEAYYQFMEQQGGVTERSKNMLNYMDIDTTIDDFVGHLYSMFLEAIPENTVADKKLILKHVKDFYRSRGSEKSVQFLLRAVFGEESTFYYPSSDILKVSDGKWYVEQSIRVFDTLVDGIANDTFEALTTYSSRRIYGNTSNATAIIETADRYFQYTDQIDELTISSIQGTFLNGETIRTYFDQDGQTHMLTSNVFGGILSEITITNGGTAYKVGQPVTITSLDSGNGAIAFISSVSPGNIADIKVIDGGCGYQVNDAIVITGGSGTGANGLVAGVTANGFMHPNTYTIYTSTIGSEANTLLGNTVYMNLRSGNINTAFQNAWVPFIYSNTGPIAGVLVVNGGENYLSVPSISASGNTLIKTIGILGRMQINNPGHNYSNNDIIQFFNVPGGAGGGAQAGINVDSNGSITHVYFQSISGYPPGGIGWSQFFLPTCNIQTSTGSNANVIAVSTLANGGTFSSQETPLGEVQTITIVTGGSNYSIPPLIDLTAFGDGTATANADVINGVKTYPGRYLNDDGFVSSYNFLENADYYQTFSYVVRIKESLDSYRTLLKNIVSPAGTKLFGQYMSIDESDNTANTTIQLNAEISTSYGFGSNTFAGQLLGNQPQGTAIDFKNNSFIWRDNQDEANNFVGSINDAISNGYITYTRPSVAMNLNSNGVLQTVSANTWREQYDPIVNYRALGYFPEPLTTNVIRNNTMAGAVVGGAFPNLWGVSSQLGISFSVVGLGVQNGINYIDIRMNGTPTATAAALFMLDSTIASVPNDIWTQSIYAEIVAGSLTNLNSNSIEIYPVSRNSGGSGIAFPTLPLTFGQGLIRTQFTVTMPALTAFIQPEMGINLTIGMPIDITIRFGLPQLEKGTNATSPILTSTQNVSRASDNMNLKITNSFRSQNAVTFISTANNAFISSPPAFTYNLYGSYEGPNYFVIRNGLSTVTNPANTFLQLVMSPAYGPIIDWNAPLTISIDNKFSVGMTLGSNGHSISAINGTQIPGPFDITPQNAQVLLSNTMSSIGIGTFSGAGQWGGPIQNFIFIPAYLGANDLISLTSL